MEVNLTPELEAQLNELAKLSGRPAGELVKDAVAYMVEDIVATRSTLDRRYRDFKTGKVTPIHGEAFFEMLRQRRKNWPLRT